MERSRTGSLGTGENSAKSCGKGRYGKADNEGTVRGVEAKKRPTREANTNVPQALYREAASGSVSSGAESPVEEER